MARNLAGILCVALLGLGSPAAAQPPPRPPCAACVALVIDASAASSLPQALNGLAILIEVPISGVVSRAAIDEIVRRGGRPGLLFDGLPGDRPVQDLTGVTTVVLDLRSAAAPDDALLFGLRTALTELRARGASDLRLGVTLPTAGLATLDAAAAAYRDFLVVDDDRAADGAVWQRLDPAGDAAAVIAATRSGRADRWLVRVPVDSERSGPLLDGLARAAGLLTPTLIEAGSNTRVTCGGADAEVFLDPATLTVVSFAPGCNSRATVAIDPAGRFDRIQVTPDLTVVRFADRAGDRFAVDVGVDADRRLTVEEIIARHQAAAARQQQRISTLISHGTLTISFEAPGFPAPVTVSSRTTIYKEGGVEDLEQQEVRVNGLVFQQRGMPRLPIIEPERASALPLAITLDDRYAYRLEGRETVGSVACYVVSFEPRSRREPLFEGRAWIAAADFGLVRRTAMQTGLKGAVVSSGQTDEFTRTPSGLWLLARSDTRQLYQGAAYRTPIQRLLEIESHDVDTADFGALRSSAYASDHVIIRNTAAGFRYLEGTSRRAPEPRAGHPAAEPTSPEGAGRRPATRVRTLALGVLVDPNISQPLPFAGLSYVDFDLFGTGAQFSGFFGGTYGQLALSVPSVAGSRWQLAGRAFGIALSYNDRAFVDGREQYDRNIEQRPAFASVALLRPLTPTLTFRAGYELEYTRFSRSDVTAAGFVVPASQVAHGLALGLEAQLHGWDATVWWTPVRRSGWRAWGRPSSDDYSSSDADFQRFGTSLARSVILSPGVVARVEAVAMGGHDLDRFSRFAFGTFENRLRGYPSALIRYDRGAAVRTALAWAASRRVRLDGFADLAYVHDPGFSTGMSPFTGIGAAVEAPAPFGMLVAAEWGYGIQGINADGQRGTHVVRVTGYKVF